MYGLRAGNYACIYITGSYSVLPLIRRIKTLLDYSINARDTSAVLMLYMDNQKAFSLIEDI